MYSDWLVLTDRCVVTGCLLIDSCDTYHSMIVRFAWPATRGFLTFSLLFSPLCGSSLRKPLASRVRIHSVMFDFCSQRYATFHLFIL